MSLRFDTSDLPQLLLDLVDTPSVSGTEDELADRVEATLLTADHLTIWRDGNNIVATSKAAEDASSGNVIIAGHLDTVPIAANLPGELIETDAGQAVWGRGSVDMKGGIAVMLQLAVTLRRTARPVTWVFYDCEEVDAALNGLGVIERQRPDLLAGDFAILCEPSNARIEGGCQGTMRIRISTRGKAAHSARGWLGHNAIHDLSDALLSLRQWRQPREVTVDGLVYREGLNAVGIEGGIAGNVIPDAATLRVNYRFAPNQSVTEAERLLRELFSGYQVEVEDAADGARPGLDRPIAQEFAAAVGGEPVAKYGWTDVARFSALGIPAVNFGPGDPSLAHADNEYCPVDDLTSCAAALRRWLSPKEIT